MMSLAKQYSVVIFVDTNSVDVIPTAWLINNSKASWPEFVSPKKNAEASSKLLPNRERMDNN